MSEPITYSSLISLSLAKYSQIFMYTDGFMSNEFQLAAFNTLHGNLFHDFQNSVFRIVPVLNFKWTQKLLKEIVQVDFQKIQNSSLVKERKQIIQSMKTNLEGEVTSNISLTKKLSGTALIFGSSQFMMVHVTSLKFLTLNDENPEDLKFNLKDFPEDGSILKFAPCLNFQKLRTNIVYNNDAVILCSVKVVCNRPPSLFSPYKGLDYKYKESRDKKLKKQFEQEVKQSKIIASIEYATRWRIEAYHTVTANENKQDDLLYVGDVIGLYLSEMKLYVNAVKPYDPFKKILQLLNVETQQPTETNNTNKEYLLKITKIQKQESMKTQMDDSKVLKQILLDDQVVAFQDFTYFAKGQTKNKILDLPNSCFWKIECVDQRSGGKVDWKKEYRLRHYQTGRYLQITKNGNIVDMELVGDPGDNSRFRFAQIQNSEDEELNYMKRDSFFYLWHCSTQHYLGISDEVKEVHPKIDQLSISQEIMLKQAYLSVVQNHYTTFRVKKIDFSDMWETSMLQYSLPFFLEAIEYIQKMKQRNYMNSVICYNDEDIQSKIYFYQIYQRVDRMLDMYSEFVNNKLISNISSKQEYGMILPNRQNVVKEQNIFILLVWMLFRCFPSKEIIESQTISYDQMIMDFIDEKEYMFRVQSFLQNKTLINHPKMIKRLNENHNKRMIVLSYKVYITIKDFCKDNKTNQKTLMKMLNIFYQHIGLGEQVIDTIIYSIDKTKQILQSLPKTMITRPKSIDDDPTEKPQQNNAIQAIILRFLDFPPFSKPDIIKLLASVCSAKEKPVFVNQNLIYRAFIENKQIYNHAFIKLSYKFGDLLMTIHDKFNQPQTINFLDFFDEQYREDPNSNYIQQYQYIKNELNLIANLCLSRNTLACKTFQQIFILNKVIPYITMNKLDYDIRAVILKLIRVLYIDQEPYQPQKRPELVREIQYDKCILSDKIIKQEGGLMSMFKVNQGNYVTMKAIDKMKKKKLVTQDTILFQTLRVKKLKQTEIQKQRCLQEEYLDESEVEESEDLQKFLETLIKNLIEYIKSKYEELQMYITSNSVYNILTLEVIQILKLILQFGFFNAEYIKPPNANTLKGQRILQQLQDDIKNSDVEKIITYLTYILEYDENYFSALNAVQVQRKFVELKQQRETKKKKNAFDDIANIGNLNVMGLLDTDGKALKERKVIHQDGELDVVSDPLFRKVKQLKKILDKCSNKTYTVKEESIVTNFEISIKMEICDIFIYLLGMRQDFMIDNAIDYFKQIFVPYTVNSIKYRNNFTELLPETACEVGEDINDIQHMKEYSSKCQVVRNFDIILERPFYESLLLSLYFSQNPQLSNKIVVLIEKYSSQRSSLIHNIIELQIVVDPEIVSFHKKWSRLLNKLKRNIPNCLAWLQLDTPQKLNGRNEINFTKNLKLIQKIIDIFQENSGDNQKMKIKQKIFKHVGGFESISELLHSCMVIINNNKETFKFKQTTTSFQQYQQFLGKQILQLMDFILQILCLFSKNSFENQELVYHKIVSTLCHYQKNNFTQVKFINELLGDNPKLTQHVQKDKEIAFHFKLIKRHGRYTEFLDFFLIILKNAESNKTGQSNVLSMHIVNFILDPKFFKFVNPFDAQPSVRGGQFYVHPPQQNYLGKFIIVLSQCLKNYIGVSLTYRAQQTFRIQYLLESLVTVSQMECHTLSDQFDQLIVKTSAFEIIMIVLERTEKINQEIMLNSTTIQKFIKLETQYLLSKTQFTQAQQVYLFQKQTPFLLKYFRAFHKDASAKIFQTDDTSKQERRNNYDYGKAFTFALNHMSFDNLNKDLDKLTRIEDICTELKLEVPKPLRRQHHQDQLIQNDDDEVEEVEENHQDGDIHTESHPQKDSFTTGPPLINENSARAFFNKFKTIKARNVNKEYRDSEDQESKQINYFWQLYVSLFSDDEDIHKAVKIEKQVFANSVWNVNAMFQSEIKTDQKDLILTQEDVVKNLLAYLQYWQQNGADKESVLFIFKVMKYILKHPLKKEEPDLLELKERQEILNKLNATKILMQLLWSENQNNLEYLATLLSLFCMLLKKGNIVVQTTVLEYSKSNMECEKMYFKLSQIIQNYINANPAELKQQGKLQTRLICKTLQFMQLLCEGHNLQLQEYLHFQSNSKTSYDLITLVVKLVDCVRIDNKNYSIIIQCFDTLTEVIQGPCRVNQIVISNSKFLDYVVNILSENEGLFEVQEVVQQQDVKIMSIIYQQAIKQNFKHTLKIAAPNKEASAKKRMKIMDHEKPYIITLHLAKLARLKLKALIALVSLVECCDPADNLILRIVRGIPLKVLTNNLSRLYSLFKQYNQDDFRMDAFGKAEEPILMTVEEEKYEIVIEIGFQIYILMQKFIASKKGKEILLEDIEMREVLNEFEVDNESKSDNGLFGGLMNIGGQVLSVGLGGLSKIKQGMEEAMKSDEQKRKEKEMQEQEEKKKQKELLKDAIRFFKIHSCSIEIVREDKVHQVFFPKLPFCDQLPKDLKNEFNDNVVRSSAKTKLNFLMQQTTSIIQTMKHEEYLRILFNINPIFGAIASQGKLYEMCLFITTIAINIIICFSYSQFFFKGDPQEDNDALVNARLYDPRFLFIEEFTITKQVIIIFGIIDLAFSSLIVFFFLLKRAPLKVHHIWSGYFETVGFFKSIVVFIKDVLLSIVVLLQDFEILYYSAYILAGIVGLAAHPFLFCVHLMDFLKLDQLKTVVKAIWQPKVELGLALMLLIILEYYFSILAWIVFYDQYPNSDQGQQFCIEFWRCLFTTFDWTFKFTGSIGAHLEDPQTLKLEEEQAIQQGDEYGGYNNVSSQIVSTYYARFFFDNIFNIMLVFILLNMIQGIIIDTFSSLKEELAEKLKDQKFKCFVCGFDMEKLDKSSDADKGFGFHIKYEHHMWNYIFYLSYLQFKDPTEYDGNESYVDKKIKALDLGWLPIKKAGCIIDEDQEDKKKLEEMDKLILQTTLIEAQLQGQLQKLENIQKQLSVE